ncbi:hypothetical protein ABKN59_006435 [Abortiporus biennis]
MEATHANHDLFTTNNVDPPTPKSNAALPGGNVNAPPQHFECQSLAIYFNSILQRATLVSSYTDLNVPWQLELTSTYLLLLQAPHAIQFSTSPFSESQTDHLNHLVVIQGPFNGYLGYTRPWISSSIIIMSERNAEVIPIVDRTCSERHTEIHKYTFC